MTFGRRPAATTAEAGGSSGGKGKAGWELEVSAAGVSRVALGQEDTGVFFPLLGNSCMDIECVKWSIHDVHLVLLQHVHI